jgi:TM2 domain-containing membrane protein YozV
MSQATAGVAPILDDPADAMRARGKSPELAAFLAWIIPGAGHLYAGHVVKGAGGLVFVMGLFVAGLFLSGGEAVSLKGDPNREIGHPYAFLAQIGVGIPTGIGLLYSHGMLPGPKPVLPLTGAEFAAQSYARGHPDRDTGLLFTMIAGLLNLLLIHDALSGVPGALVRRADERRRQSRLDALRAEVLAEREAAAAAAEAPSDAPSVTANEPAPPGVEADASADAPGVEAEAPSDAPTVEGDASADAPTVKADESADAPSVEADA